LCIIYHSLLSSFIAYDGNSQSSKELMGLNNIDLYCIINCNIGCNFNYFDKCCLADYSNLCHGNYLIFITIQNNFDSESYSNQKFNFNIKHHFNRFIKHLQV
jgi:hypothetical protein